ncbi:MAG: hypothetical protein GX182_05430 [Firmicutes bacterium]|nr:hypothetical protein [Bacillota bacterium]
MLKQRVENYLDSVLAGVGESRQLAELKEELTTNLLEKISDYQGQGMEEDEAFREAIASLGDLSALVDDLRRNQGNWPAGRVDGWSIASIIGGVLLCMFGLFTVVMMYVMPAEDPVATAGPGIFIVIGGALLTYGLLTRETKVKYPMPRLRALLYGLSVGLLLFALFSSTVTRYATGEQHPAVAAMMVFSLAGVGLLLFLVLTEKDRRKSS